MTLFDSVLKCAKSCNSFWLLPYIGSHELYQILQTSTGMTFYVMPIFSNGGDVLGEVNNKKQSTTCQDYGISPGLPPALRLHQYFIYLAYDHRYLDKMTRIKLSNQYCCRFIDQCTIHICINEAVHRSLLYGLRLKRSIWQYFVGSTVFSCIWSFLKGSQTMI